MDIVIAANFCRDFSETDNGRFVYLAKILAQNHNVEIITSDFYHGKKVHRSAQTAKFPFKITFVHEPGYKQNVSPQRLMSHRILGKNLYRYLCDRNKPDVIYCAVPSLDFAAGAMRYAKEQGIRFVVDIQDLWPEAFQMVLNIPVISKLLFAPMARQADRIYAAADHIVAVSKTYASRAARVNPEAKNTIAFLGTQMDIFDSYASEKISGGGRVKLCYIGTLGRSYDLENVIIAISRLPHPDMVELVVMGDGPMRGAFEECAKELGVHAEFTGRLPYDQMVSRLCQCDIAVNPIRKGSAGSIINKVGDYAMAGLPVLNTQESTEYRKLVEGYQMGLNCANEDANDLAEKMEMLLNSPELRHQFGQNARRCAQECFDRCRTYECLANAVLGEGMLVP